MNFLGVQIKKIGNKFSENILSLGSNELNCQNQKKIKEFDLSKIINIINTLGLGKK